MYWIGFHRSLDVLMTFGYRLKKRPICLSSSPLVPAAQPTIRKEDAAIVCSATGETSSVVSLAANWQGINENIAVITSLKNSSLLETLQKPKLLVLIPGIKDEDAERTRTDPLFVEQSLDSDFDHGSRDISSHTKFQLATLLFVEGVVAELYFSLSTPSREQSVPRRGNQ